MALKNILVLCQGNICRSPMAEALLAQCFPDCKVQSAGLSAMVGWPADPLSVELISQRGLDISAHSARQISFGMVREAEIILTMNIRQKEKVMMLYSFTRGRVFSLGERVNLEIVDPYQQSKSVFERSLAEIDAGISSWLPRLLKL